MNPAPQGPVRKDVEPAIERDQHIAAAWSILAGLLFTGLYVRHRHVLLDGDFHGWASSSCMLMARAFNMLGFLRTHFVPFQNYLPFGRDPDVYLHWPPLYPVLLAICLRTFGDSVITARFFELAITLSSAGLVGSIARKLYGVRIGWLSVFFFFTSRAIFECNLMIIQQPLALLLELAAIYCFLPSIDPIRDKSSRGHQALTVLGACSTSLMVLAAWDPIFVPFGMLGIALWIRNRRATRVAAVYCATALGTFLMVELDYLLSYPTLFANQLGTIAYRAGLHFPSAGSIRLSTIVDVVHYDVQYGLIPSYWHALRFADQFLSSLSLATLVLFTALWIQNGGLGRDASGASQAAGLTLAALVLPIVLWFAVMRNYVAIHQFPLIFFVPAAAIASAVFFDRFWNLLSARASNRPQVIALIYVVPAILLLPLFMDFRDADLQPTTEFVSLSELIRTSTSPNAVILTPSVSLTLTFYSERHVVRGIENELWLSHAIPQAHADFPGSPLYLGLLSRDKQDFPQTLARVAPYQAFGDADLYRLP